jgi:hypothetical protein
MSSIVDVLLTIERILHCLVRRLHLQQDSLVPGDRVHCTRVLSSDDDVEDRALRNLPPVPRLSHIFSADTLVIPAWDRECHDVPMRPGRVLEVH